MIKFDLLKTNGLKEGDYVLTNGEKDVCLTREIYGIIGHITDDYIYIFQNRKINFNISSVIAREKLSKSIFDWAIVIKRNNKTCYIKKTKMTPTDYLNYINLKNIPTF